MARNRRSLPHLRIRIMLQQTQVESRNLQISGVPEAFPSIDVLANTRLVELLNVWSGLGITDARSISKERRNRS